MKLCYFHLMPYQYLPDDFEKRYHSVWVDIPNYLYDPAKGHQLYNDYLDQLEHADQLGFDAICVNEHHSNAYGGMPSPNLMAAALARRTSRAAIVVMGNSLGLYNPPIRVAEEFAMLDVLSGGRLVAGMPLGSAADAVFAYGEVPAIMRQKYEEAHDLIIRAWAEREAFSFNGRFTQLRYVSIWPRPLQQPHPPIWVPGSGSVETWDWTIKHQYVYSYLSFRGYKVGQLVLNGFWEELDRSGAEFNPNHAGFLQLVAISDTDDQVEEYKPHIEYFFNKCQHLPIFFANPPGYRSLKTARSDVSKQILSAVGRQTKEFTWKDYIVNGTVIAGSPSSVREELKEAIKGLKVGNLMLLLHFGSMPKALAAKNMKLFASEVMPYVKDMWSEYDHPWWPRPMPEVERAASSANA